MVTRATGIAATTIFGLGLITIAFAQNVGGESEVRYKGFGDQGKRGREAALQRAASICGGPKLVKILDESPEAKGMSLEMVLRFKCISEQEVAEIGARLEAERSIPAEYSQAFALKDDQLGLGLSIFREKYRRQAGSAPTEVAPMCSDRTKSPAVQPPEKDIGLVNCTLSFPFESLRADFSTPTVAGYHTIHPAKSPVGYDLIFRFVETEKGNRLWSIEAILPHSTYSELIKALEAKYGPPPQQETQTLQNAFGAKFEGQVLVWQNAVSRVIASEYFGSRDASALLFRLTPLEATVSERLNEAAKKRASDL
jgi:hypothetical protein